MSARVRTLAIVGLAVAAALLAEEQRAAAPPPPTAQPPDRPSAWTLAARRESIGG